MGNRLTVEPLMIPQPHPTYNHENEKQFRRSIQDALNKLSAQARSADPPTISSVVVTLKTDSSVIATINGNKETQSFRALIQSTLPADATLRAASATNGQSGTLTASALGGTTGYVSVFPYAAQNGIGEEGQRFDVQFSTQAGTTAIPQGTVSVDANGVVGFTVDLPTNAGSYQYLLSTSAYPSDATVVASGTLVALGSNHTDTRNSIATLSFGQTGWISIVPFTGGSGGGTQLQSIHIRGAYLTYTPSKTTNYSPTAWVGASSVSGTPYSFDSYTGNIYPNPNLYPGVTAVFAIDFVLPNSVTITQAQFDLAGYVDGTHFLIDGLTFRVTRVTGSSTTSLGTVAVTGVGTWTVALSESTTSHSYQATAELNNYRAGTGGLPSLSLGGLSVTYTMADPTTTV